ncbi:MAG: vitamin epoxide reductase [Parcubacteria group bacterium]|nr:vitamin epoxide reductase [Parcubacteria group bacterium]
MKRLGATLILLFAFCGLADSAYLTQHAASGLPLICDIQSFSLSGCNIVATSEYSKILGIPVANLGIVFYAVMFILAAVELVIPRRIVRRLLQIGAVLGVLMSLFSTTAQIFFINALCIYCLASALLTVFIAICAALIEPLSFKQISSAQGESVAPQPFTLPPEA